MTNSGQVGHMTEPRLRSYYERASLGFLILLTGAVFLLDAFTPRGVPAWILYLITLVLTHRHTYAIALSFLATC